MASLSRGYIGILKRYSKGFLYASLTILILGIIVQTPQPLTHRCVPNFATQLGVINENYPTKRYFCKVGYYPELKWGLQGVYDSAITKLFLFYVPAMALIPTGYIIVSEHLKSSKKDND